MSKLKIEANVSEINTHCSAVTINKSMDDKTVFDQLVVSVAVPQSIWMGAEILPPTNHSAPSDEPPDTVNTL